MVGGPPVEYRSETTFTEYNRVVYSVMSRVFTVILYLLAMYSNLISMYECVVNGLAGVAVSTKLKERSPHMSVTELSLGSENSTVLIT